MIEGINGGMGASFNQMSLKAEATQSSEKAEDLQAKQKETIKLCFFLFFFITFTSTANRVYLPIYETTCATPLFQIYLR